MNKYLLLYIVSAFVLLGCGGPFGKWELQRDAVGEINSGVGRHNVEIVVKDGVEYQVEHSGAHPAISWAVGPRRLEALEKNISDNISYGTIYALQDNRYTFLKECKGTVIIGDE